MDAFTLSTSWTHTVLVAEEGQLCEIRALALLLQQLLPLVMLLMPSLSAAGPPSPAASFKILTETPAFLLQVIA